MIEALQQLHEALFREQALYEAMLKLAERQRASLIARRTDDLSDETQRQAKLVTEARQAETVTHAALVHLAAHVGLPETASLSQVAVRLPAADAHALTRLRDATFTTAVRLGHVNQLNAELFASAVDSVRFTLQTLAEACQPAEPCYAATETAARPPALLLDRCA